MREALKKFFTRLTAAWTWVKSSPLLLVALVTVLAILALTTILGFAASFLLGVVAGGLLGLILSRK